MIDTSKLDPVKHAHLIEEATKLNDKFESESAVDNFLMADLQKVKRRVAIATAVTKYVKPKSTAWWAGTAPLVGGVILALGNTFDTFAPAADLVKQFAGQDATVAELVSYGIAVIGIRGAMK